MEADYMVRKLTFGLIMPSHNINHLFILVYQHITTKPAHFAPPFFLFYQNQLLLFSIQMSIKAWKEISCSFTRRDAKNKSVELGNEVDSDIIAKSVTIAKLSAFLVDKEYF